MKTFIALLALTFSSAYAVECARPEAQFFGVVTEKQEFEYYQVLKRCYVKIAFTDYRESEVCGLPESAASSQIIKDEYCALNKGDAISGYLVFRNGEIVIE